MCAKEETASDPKPAPQPIPNDAKKFVSDVIERFYKSCREKSTALSVNEIQFDLILFHFTKTEMELGKIAQLIGIDRAHLDELVGFMFQSRGSVLRCYQTVKENHHVTDAQLESVISEVMEKVIKDT